MLFFKEQFRTISCHQDEFNHQRLLVVQLILLKYHLQIKDLNGNKRNKVKQGNDASCWFKCQFADSNACCFKCLLTPSNGCLLFHMIIVLNGCLLLEIFACCLNCLLGDSHACLKCLLGVCNTCLHRYYDVNHQISYIPYILYISYISYISYILMN